MGTDRTTRQIVLATAAGWLLALGVNRCLRRVTGDSMRPALEPGEVVVVVPAWLRRPRPGDVVVVTDPREPTRTVIKRVAATGPGGLRVLGDNPAASTDSRTFGRLSGEQLRGWVPFALGLPPRWLGH